MGLVRNDITEEVPGAGTVRLSMDFGDLSELQVAGVTITSCAVAILTVTSPVLTFSAVQINAAGYRVSALFSGGLVNSDYSISFTPTLSTGQTLPPRTGILKLR